MKNILKKQARIVAIICYLGVVAAMFYFMVFPLINHINEKSNSIQEAVLKREGVARKINELPKIEQQYKNLENNESDIDFLLDKNKAVVLIEQLEKAAQESENNITIEVQDKIERIPVKTSNKAGKPVVDTSLIGNLPSDNYLQMKINLVGKYNAIMNFVGLLENFEYYNDIVTIQIINNEDNGTSGGERINSGDIFGSPTTSGIENVKNQSLNSDNKKLKASLDVVFYLK